MKIQIRPLNKGETFCCSVRAAKEMFKNTDINLNFAFYSRDYGTFAHSPDAYYLKNNIKGRVIAALYAHNKTTHTNLSFYVIKKNEFTQKIIEDFEKSFLPKFYDFYHNHLQIESLSDKTAMMLVELYKHQLIMHIKKID